MIKELNTYLHYDEKESNVFMQNEIFADLKNNSNKNKHIPFAYSYYYLILWLYRYAKYGVVNIDNRKIKQILGYSPTYPEIDYIIKKNGILDIMDYTITTKNFPISWTFEDGLLKFDMLSDFDDDMQKTIKETKSRKFAIKFPVKAFHRTKESEDDNYEDGTFFEIDNTHLVPFEVFMFCMSKKEIGCTGFYLWSYLKMQNQIYEKGYDVSIDNLAEEVGIPRRTMCKYLDALRAHKMIECYYNQDFFCIAIGKEERKSNTYVTNECDKFSNSKVEIRKIKYVSEEEYKEMNNNNVDLFDAELFG